jgi:hypothetical protein
MAKQARKGGVACIILSLLLVPSALTAKEKHGEWLRIEKADGATVEGELLKVSGETLFMFDQHSQLGSQVNLGDVQQLGLRRKTDVAGGLGIGLLAGLGAGLAGGAIGAKLFGSKDSGQSAGIYILSMNIFVLGGIVAGVATNGFQGRFQTRRVAGLPEEKRLAILSELKEWSRETRNYYPGIMR